MVDCALSLLFSVLLVCFNVQILTCQLPGEITNSKPKDCFNLKFLGVGGFLFTAAVFNTIARLDINFFVCELPTIFLFFYEFIVSLFLMECAVYMVWNPLQEFMTKSLPKHCEWMVIQDGDCAISGFYCKGHTLMFEILTNSLALGFFWSTMFGLRVVQME